MVHRDIKPQNLMVQFREGSGEWGVGSEAEESRPQPAARSTQSAARSTQHAPRATPCVKILDFGLARFAMGWHAQASETTAGAGTGAGSAVSGSSGVVGTPDYIAPEQVTHTRRADIRADIYSLGCTLYYLLAGLVPFPRGSVTEKLAAHVEQTARPLAELRGDVPAAVAGVVARMMAKEPGQRFQTPREVAEALECFVNEAAATSELPKEPKLGPVEKNRKSARLALDLLRALVHSRGRAMVALVGLLAVAGAWPAWVAIRDHCHESLPRLPQQEVLEQQMPGRTFAQAPDMPNPISLDPHPVLPPLQAVQPFAPAWPLERNFQSPRRSFRGSPNLSRRG